MAGRAGNIVRLEAAGSHQAKSADNVVPPSGAVAPSSALMLAIARVVELKESFAVADRNAKLALAERDALSLEMAEAIAALEDPALGAVGANDLVEGATCIAEILGVNAKKVYRIAAKAGGPVRKVPGRGLVASKIDLIKWRRGEH